MTCSLTGDGLRLADGRTVPWAKVYHVEWTATGAVVATAAGMLAVDRATGAALEQRLAPWEPLRDAWVESLTDAQRAELAGLPPDRPLGSRTQRADCVGLWLGGTLVPWEELRALGERAPGRYELLTRHGRVRWRARDDAEPLLAAVRRVLATRAAAVPAEAGAGEFVPGAAGPRAGGLWLDEAGLVVVWPDEQRRRAWTELHPPRWSSAGPVIGGIELRRYLDGEALAHRLDARLGTSAPAAAGEELLPATIERWLGVPPGGALHCRLASRRRWVHVGALAALLTISLAAALSDHDFTAFLMIPLLVPILLALVRSAMTVVADGQGLSVRAGRRSRYYAWSEVEGLRQGAFDWVIHTRRGNLHLALAARGHDKVVGIVKHLLAVRATGAQLPTAAPTPEQALSRMPAPESLAARGLSVTEEGEP